MLKFLSVLGGKFKVYWWAFLGGLLTIMAVTIKFLTHRNSVLRDRAEYAKAYANRAKVIADRDNELEAQERSHRAEVKNDLQDSRDSRTFRNPGRLFDQSDD